MIAIYMAVGGTVALALSCIVPAVTEYLARSANLAKNEEKFQAKFGPRNRPNVHRRAH